MGALLALVVTGLILERPTPSIMTPAGVPVVQATQEGN